MKDLKRSSEKGLLGFLVWAMFDCQAACEVVGVKVNKKME